MYRFVTFCSVEALKGLGQWFDRNSVRREELSRSDSERALLS